VTSGASADVRALLDVISAGFPQLGTTVLDADQARRMLAGDQRRAPRPVGRLEERQVPDGPGVRVYWPAGDAVLRPGLVFFHGGGVVLCDLDSHDAICRDLCVELESVVVSVDYRRAPEHRYPAALDDADGATRWVYDNAAELGIDTEGLGVAGDSAGGNLAAGVAQRWRDNGRAALAVQVLVYPMLDPRCDSPSYATYAERHFVTAQHLHWYWDCYRSAPEDDEDPGFAPPRARRLDGLAPAVVVVAALDPLADEGRAYARAMASAGTPVDLLDCAGLFHGFVGFGEQLPEAARAVEQIVAAVRHRVTAVPARD